MITGSHPTDRESETCIFSAFSQRKSEIICTSGKLSDSSFALDYVARQKNSGLILLSSLLNSYPCRLPKNLPSDRPWYPTNSLAVMDSISGY